MTTNDVSSVARRLASSEKLRQRRYELLPLRGTDAARALPQGRGAGSDAYAAEQLQDLVSSIGEIGLLQPILVQELPDGTRQLIAGERRLRAARWGADHHPDNQHFDAIPAVVCPGPLSEEEWRSWQLVENLARDDLKPGELGAALLFERCALLTVRLLTAGVAVPAEISGLDDPLERWEALERCRLAADCHSVGAPWDAVLKRLGIQLSPRRAELIVRAFRALPAEISTEMDVADVALRTRLDYLAVARGHTDAADELWAAVRDSDRPELLSRAAREISDHPELTATAAIERADQARTDAHEARCEALRRHNNPDETVEIVDADTVAAATGALKELCAQLRAGRTLGQYDAGSLALFVDELAGHLTATDEEERADAA